MKKHPAMLNLHDEQLLAHRAAMLEQEEAYKTTKDPSLMTEQVLFEGNARVTYPYLVFFYFFHVSTLHAHALLSSLTPRFCQGPLSEGS